MFNVPWRDIETIKRPSSGVGPTSSFLFSELVASFVRTAKVGGTASQNSGRSFSEETGGEQLPQPPVQKGTPAIPLCYSFSSIDSAVRVSVFRRKIMSLF